MCFTSDKTHPVSLPLADDIPVINNGTVVQIKSTRCNGIKECWNDKDELECGFSTSFTIFIGMNKKWIRSQCISLCTTVVIN